MRRAPRPDSQAEMARASARGLPERKAESRSDIDRPAFGVAVEATPRGGGCEGGP